MPDAASVYSDLREKRRSEIALLEQRLRMLGYARLACVALAAVLVWLALSARAVSIVWVILPVILFTALLIVHERGSRRLERVRRAERYFTRGLDRLAGVWMGKGEPGNTYLNPAHPYAQDLDLFGKGSLFELLCTARTHIGEDTLARWLLSPAPPEIARRRQEAVEALRTRLSLREDLAIVAEEARTGVDPVSLAGWGEAPSLLAGHPVWIAWIFTAAGIVGLGALFAMLATWAGVADWPASRAVLFVVLLMNSSFLLFTRSSVGAVVTAVEEAAHELALLAETLRHIEREQFRTPLLAELRASLDSDGAPPSRRIARLQRLVEYLDSRDNVFVRILEVFLLWTPHLAIKVEDWRRHSGAAVRRWLEATGELEALCSLAGQAYEHPGDVFPEFSEGGPSIEAEAIGHPLIAEDRVVRNDVSIAVPLQVLIVSGSNMSGKSTLLRTLGVNAVLAQAGAPVRAKRLRLSPLAIGASIRVNDSLQGGVSRFYAEILRLRQILDLAAGPLPVLFLIDEFLHGTNSHDRRIGAEALVRGLVERGAIGLVTTHDLALAEIVSELGNRAVNVHFEDRIEDGEIHFDYRMRPGIVRRSNAIELMRSVGLRI